MKFIHFLPMMLAQLIIVALVALVSADEEDKKQNECTENCPLIPHGHKTKENALIITYVLATVILLVLIPWFLWHIIRNWGSWKIHTGSPRPQYIRTSFRWVDLETWKEKKAKQARRKEAKRDQHTIYRTTKANYKWIFHDPTGDLQKRFNEQKGRSHLRFLPSWMRSYPHGTLQSGILPQQSKASNEIYQLPNLHVNENSCLSNLESFGNLQFDGSTMSGALPDPYYQFPNLKMDCHDAMTPNTPRKACSLPILPVMDEPNVVQVWFVDGNNARPERTGSPPTDSEEEPRGEVESAEEVMQSDLEHRLEIMGHRQLERIFAIVAPVYESLLMPYPWPPLPNRTGLEVRSQPYIDYLESRILLLEERLRGVPADRIPGPTRHALDTYIQELERVTGVRRPEPCPLPHMIRYAIELQQEITDLETQIEALKEQPEDLPLHDTLDSLINKLRKAKLEQDRLPPIHGLPEPVPTSRRQLELHQIFRPANADVAAEPRPRVLPGVGIIVEAPGFRANTTANHDDNSMTELRGELDSRDIPAVQTSAMTRDTFGDLFRGHPTRRASASAPTISTPQTHGEANHAVIEGLAMDDNTTPGPMSGEGLDKGGNRTITEGTSTGGSSNPNPTPEPELRPDPIPDVGSQDVEMGTEAAPIHHDGGGGGPSSSAASAPNTQATTASRDPTTMAPVPPDVNDALVEELYSDRY